MSNNLSSNKRNKKVIITDLAIEKVPYVEYKDIDKNHYETLYILAKKVLYIAKTTNDSNEVAIVYKLSYEFDIKNIGIAFGDEHNVNPAASTNAYHILSSSEDCAVVILHNHPSTSHISLMDIGYFLDSTNVKLLIMVTNKGTLSYIVKLKKFNRLKAIKVLNKAIDKHNSSKSLKEKQKAVDYFFNNSSKLGIYYSNYKK